VKKLSWFENLSPVIQTLIATTFTWGITALGALVVCFFKETNRKILDTILGFSAGVMIAASFWSLISPSLELSLELGYIVWLLPAIGFSVGGLFVLLSDKFLDIVLKNRKNLRTSDSLKRSILLISAITIHNIPEGMSIGVAFGGIASGVPGMTAIGAVMLAIGIGIQNFPEGAAVSLPLRSEGYSRFKSFMIGQASALVEPISAVIGVVLVMYVRNVLPFLLAFAAGAMIVVAARELLPESVKENKNLSTIGLITGFIIMMILDVVLG
jgi:ZIP family zinc transporter